MNSLLNLRNVAYQMTCNHNYLLNKKYILCFGWLLWSSNLMKGLLNKHYFLLPNNHHFLPGKEVLGKRGNWGILNDCYEDPWGPLQGLLAVKTFEKEKGGGREGAKKVFVCACMLRRTLSLTHLVLVGSVCLQRCRQTIAEETYKHTFVLPVDGIIVKPSK